MDDLRRVIPGAAPVSRGVLLAGAVSAAPALLGCLLARRDDAGAWRTGVIVETEAYTRDDPASHSFRGQTPRNAMMFAGPGLAYVYRSHGLHWCFNVVTGREGDGEAVLVRAIEPLAGIDAMIAARGWNGRPLRDLANGPGKLTVALGITDADQGLDLLDPAGPLRVLVDSERRITGRRVVVTTRVGITKAADWPRRFLLAR